MSGLSVDQYAADHAVRGLSDVMDHRPPDHRALVPVTGLVLLPQIRWRGAIIRMRLTAYARRQVIAIEGRRLGRPQHVQRQQLAGAFRKFVIAAAQRGFWGGGPNCILCSERGMNCGPRSWRD
jgi:hypothetical protein